MARDVALREVVIEVAPEQRANDRVVIFTAHVVAGIRLKWGNGFVKVLGPDTRRELKRKARHHLTGAVLDRYLWRKERETFAQNNQAPRWFSLPIRDGYMVLS